MLLHDSGDQRRHHQHVMNVIAVIGHQHRLLARQDDDIADIVLFRLELVHVQRVFQQRFRRHVRHGRICGIGHIAQQFEIAFQLLQQLLSR